MDEFVMRQSDLVRIESAAKETSTAVNQLVGVIGDLRVDIAKNYVTKAELVQLLKDEQAEDERRDQVMVGELKDHKDDDTRRFNELKKMFAWAIGTTITTLIGVISILVEAFIKR